MQSVLRYHAVLALAVWYLMTPPVIRVPRSASRVNPAAHLKYWRIRGSYASLSACDDAGRALLKIAKANPDNMPESVADLSSDVMGQVMQNMVCISSDDPRLM